MNRKKHKSTITAGQLESVRKMSLYTDAKILIGDVPPPVYTAEERRGVDRFRAMLTNWRGEQ